MANLKDLIVNGAARIVGKVYASEFVGNLAGNAETATNDSDGNPINSTYLPLAGGTMGGPIHFNPNSLPVKQLSYICGIDSFADGGEMGWQSRDEFLTYKSIDGTLTASTITATNGFNGNLTGDVTGSSGSCTGNAKTATTADKTAYGISVKDAASNPAVNGWNGSAAKTLTIAGTSPITTTATANTITITHNKGGANTSKGDTSNQAPGFGGTFKVTYATVDEYGHTTTLTDHTVTIPSTEASTSASGIVTAGAQTFGGPKTFADTTDSTNNTSGAVIVSGGLGVAKNIYAAAVHNAVWNDLVDCMEVPEDTSLEFGYCYSWKGDSVIKSSRSSKNCIGIHSNTAGFVMGEKKTKTIQAAVAGFVLAYVDKLYPEGTPLTWGDDGVLTKCNLLKRVLHPERIIATFYKEEKEEKWHNLPVSGRHWVKIV